jgi:hypothetical protein
MKMNNYRYIITILVLSYFTLCSASVGEDDNLGLNVDYLKLTRSSLPCPRVIVSAAFENLDFNLATFKERIARVYRSALYPESVNLAYGHGPDGLSSYGFSERSTIGTRNGSFNNSSTQLQHGTIPNEYMNRDSLSLSMRWDLQKLFGFDSEELNTLADVINQVDQEGFALNQIARSYGQLIAALPEESVNEIPQSKTLLIIEHAAILDSLSGGLLTDILRQEVSPSIKVTTNEGMVDIDRSSSLLNEKSNVIEVRDGQDDGIEVVGGASK